MRNVEEIAAGVFKTKCLDLMDQVKETGRTITITKRGEPVAKLVPVERQMKQPFGSLQGTVTIASDITKPIEERWDAGR